MKKLQTIQEVLTFINESHLAFLYVSQEDCSVCHSLRPKLIELLKNYSKIELREVEAEKVKEISAEYLVFSAPTLLFSLMEKNIFEKENLFSLKS